MLIAQSMFRQINDPKHPLHNLLPPVKVSHSQMVLRPTYPYQIPLAKTSRRGRDCTVLYFQEVLVMLHNLHV